MKQNSTRRGFTLIELLVVVIIIAILAAIALPQYQKAVMKARAAEIQTFIAHVEKAMDLYVLENGYPSSYKNIPWDEMGIDVSSYCDSINNGGDCIAKNFRAGVGVSSDDWSMVVSVLGSDVGGSWLSIISHKDGHKEKTCAVDPDKLGAKPICDALKANDSSWNVMVGS